MEQFKLVYNHLVNNKLNEKFVDWNSKEVILNKYQEFINSPTHQNIKVLKRTVVDVTKEFNLFNEETFLNNGKEIILNYCKTLKTHDIDHLQSAIENQRYIEKGEYDMLNGCPSAYGLDDHIGLCEIEDIGQNYEKQKEQCLQCWTKALESEYTLR